MKFKIVYPETGIEQYKTLITQEQHKFGKSMHSKEVRKAYFSQFGDYFTDESPLYRAMQTGVLTCNNQSIKTEVIFQRG